MNVNDYEDVKRLEEEANRLGFKVSTGGYSGARLCLMPKGKVEDQTDCLPVYARDATFGFNGTVEGLLAFIAGWQKAMEYTRALDLVSQEKIAKKEDLYRQERLARVIKEGKLHDLTI